MQKCNGGTDRHNFCSILQRFARNSSKLPFSALTLLVNLGNRHPASKKFGVDLFVTTRLELCTSIYSFTTTSITLNSNKIQNGDILVPANPGPAETMPVKTERERERERDRETEREKESV